MMEFQGSLGYRLWEIIMEKLESYKRSSFLGILHRDWPQIHREMLGILGKEQPSIDEKCYMVMFKLY